MKKGIIMFLALLLSSTVMISGSSILRGEVTQTESAEKNEETTVVAQDNTTDNNDSSDPGIPSNHTSSDDYCLVNGVALQEGVRVLINECTPEAEDPAPSAQPQQEQPVDPSPSLPACDSSLGMSLQSGMRKIMDCTVMKDWLLNYQPIKTSIIARFFVGNKTRIKTYILIVMQMKNFLFENYGYYPKNMDKEEFYIDGWKFKLIPTSIDKDTIIEIEKYMSLLNKEFNKGPAIIKNKLGEYTSRYGDEEYVLISIKCEDMSIDDLNRFHLLFYKRDEYIELDKVLVIWKERIDKIEKELNSSLEVNSTTYKDNLEASMFSIGLGINALQYLSDIIHNYDKKLYGVSIAHKRLNKIDTFEILNPFNFIVDHPLKDTVMLYENDQIDFSKFTMIINDYHLDIIGASFLLARLLYRFDVFDLIEKKRDITSSNRSFNFHIEREIDKIKRVYLYLKNQYSIRPIDWLEAK